MKKNTVNKHKAYYRLDAETKLRKIAIDHAIQCMKILPHTYQNVLVIADDLHQFMKGVLFKEDIEKLPEDITKGLRNKYRLEDPYEDLT